MNVTIRETFTPQEQEAIDLLRADATEPEPVVDPIDELRTQIAAQQAVIDTLLGVDNG